MRVCKGKGCVWPSPCCPRRVPPPGARACLGTRPSRPPRARRRGSGWPCGSSRQSPPACSAGSRWRSRGWWHGPPAAPPSAGTTCPCAA
eukprot:scaffold29995_cov101-Isochrysis_galbana.AAC.2